jgi:hypothetical protein
MKKMHKLGIFLEGGGIRTFYGGGVIDELKALGVRPDYYVGISASAGTIFGNMHDCSEEIIKIFGKKCDENKKNFYWTKKPHFPHNEMMGGALGEIFSRHIPRPNSKDYAIIAGITSKNNEIAKKYAVSILMLGKILGINFFDKLRKTLNIEEAKITQKDGLTGKEIVNFIMGSSSIYPFIKQHYYQGKLLVEVNSLNLDYEKILRGCNKGIIIHNAKGKTFIRGKMLHLYSKKTLEWNILDYTSKEKLQELRKEGKRQVREQIGMIRAFLK